MLRRYRSLQTQGFGIKGREVTYEPFKLVLSFREAPKDSLSEHQSPSPLTPTITSMLLVLCATPVVSIYKGKRKFHTNTNFNVLYVQIHSNYILIGNFSPEIN